MSFSLYWYVFSIMTSSGRIVEMPELNNGMKKHLYRVMYQVNMGIFMGFNIYQHSVSKVNFYFFKYIFIVNSTTVIFHHTSPPPHYPPPPNPSKINF